MADWIDRLMSDYIRPNESHVSVLSPSNSHPTRSVGVSLFGDCFSCKQTDERQFVLTSGLLDGEMWEYQMKIRGIKIDEDVEAMLKCIVPNGPIDTEMVILEGRRFQGDASAEMLQAEVKHLGLVTPDPALACILRLGLTAADIHAMGFHSINVLHAPIRDLTGCMSQFSLEDAWLTYRFEEEGAVSPRAGYAFERKRH